MTVFLIAYSIFATLAIFGLLRFIAPQVVNQLESGSGSQKLLDPRKQSKKLRLEENLVKRAEKRLREKLIDEDDSYLGNIYFKEEALVRFIDSKEDFNAFECFSIHGSRDVMSILRDDLRYCDFIRWDELTEENRTRLVEFYIRLIKEYVVKKTDEIHSERRSMAAFEKKYSPTLMMNAAAISAQSPAFEETEKTASPQDSWEEQFGELTGPKTDEVAQ